MNAETEQQLLIVGERLVLCIQQLDLTVEALVAEMKKSREAAKEPDGLI
jgi:hypothetical protein